MHLTILAHVYSIIEGRKERIQQYQRYQQKIILRMCDILTFMCHVEINVKWYSDRNILNVSFWIHSHLHSIKMSILLIISASAVRVNILWKLYLLFTSSSHVNYLSVNLPHFLLISAVSQMPKSHAMRQRCHRSLYQLSPQLSSTVSNEMQSIKNVWDYRSWIAWKTIL